MAYVQPNSTLQLFKGINLDNRYLHTIYFANEAAQDTWFTSKVTSALTFNNLTYRRYTSDSVKIQIDATKLFGVSYMRFKNDRSVDKWFYAFVLDIDYINENTAVVYYEIDVMQTWFIQGGSIRPCMVLREHVNDDTFGTNLEQEPVGSETYDCDELSYTSTDGDLFGWYCLVVNTNEDPTDRGTPVINNGLVNGTAFEKLLRSTSSDYSGDVSTYLNLLITRMNGSWEDGSKPIEVVDMFTFPEAFAHINATDNTHRLTITHPTTLDGYTPKNKKLYGYPYSFLQLTDKDGSGCSLKWEYFAGMLETSNDAEFEAYGNAIGGGQIMCYPRDYNGIVDNIDAGIKRDDFPKNPFTYDAYQAWIASGGSTKLAEAQRITNIRGVIGVASSISNFTSDLTSGLNIIGDSATSSGDTLSQIAGVTAGANKIIQSGLSAMSKTLDIKEAKNKIKYAWKDAQYQPDIVVGKATPNLAVAKGYLDFYFQSVHVRVDELKRLDDFFSCFGYAVNKVKQPALTGRSYWNFVQTQNSVITGNMPSSSKEAIGRIFDGGITFWHNGDQIGNYRQSVSQGSINNPIA